ncbi:MAG TPA: DUF4388 domain-containing protein [Anaerolineae bacterium]|nr:DUF4388 domain-containing protein [Anaerolineae bacterium]
MAIEGDLRDMSLPTLVQLVVHERGQARIEVENKGNKGFLYLAEGELHHVELHRGSGDAVVAEEVVYELLTWREGAFKIEKDVPPPERSVAHSWDYLVMEGLRQLDEQGVVDEGEESEESLADMMADLSPDDAAMLQNLLAQHSEKEEDEMASKSEQLKSLLNELVNSSTDILGAAVVDSDGLLLASALSGSLDGNRVAAVTAGLISLSSRSAQQLGQGGVKQTLIQAENGNIIAIRASDRASFVGLTPVGVNLGMAFMECGDAAAAVGKIL